MCVHRHAKIANISQFLFNFSSKVISRKSPLRAAFAMHICALMLQMCVKTMMCLQLRMPRFNAIGLASQSMLWPNLPANEKKIFPPTDLSPPNMSTHHLSKLPQAMSLRMLHQTVH